MTATRRAKGEGAITHDEARGRYIGIASFGTNPVTGRRIRRKVTGRTKLEVRARLTALLEQGPEPPAPARPMPTVGALVDELLASPPGSWKSPVTMQVNTGHALRIKSALGAIRADELTVSHVRALLQGMADSGLSTSTIDKCRGVLRLALSRAEEDEILTRNVAAVLRNPPKGTLRKSRSMTMEQAGKLLALELEPWWRAFLTVALGMGLRPGELLGLSWDDVDTDTGMLSVCHSLKKLGGELVLADLKTASSRRTMEMPAEVVAALKAHRSAQLKTQMRSATWRDSGLVFCSRVGTPRQETVVLSEFKALCQRAGLGREWKLHELRHTWVSVLSHNHVPIEQIADAAGHANSRVTQTVYRHSLADVVTVTSGWHFAPQAEVAQ